jgi:DNA-binding transcriptional LysR family regulator
MDKFKRMQTFVRIVEGGSLTAAANALEVSQPSVVRLLAALEADLGVRLINRTTRRMALTDEGREYYERCRAILGLVDEAEAQLKSRRAEPRGRLRLTAPVLFGRLFIAPVVNEFLARHAAVQVELLLLDRVVDLLEEGIDAAVRRVTVGSPALIRRRGRPARAEDLAGAPVVSFTGLGPADEWSFERAGRALRVKVAPVFVSNQIDAALAAGEAGLGWGRFLSYQVAAALRDGRLKRVLDDEDATPLPVQIVYPHARLLSANLRALVDFAVPRLRKQLAALD